ncbi:MAG: phosphoenolpyruvate--protein phosphotransferase [Lachnospiraceae bacterium]|nr:phosphoenolpyruvate--protein phosphotransferase [Lachnospiraceae bacterium]
MEKQNQVFQGKNVYGGIAIGSIRLLSQSEGGIRRIQARDVEAEVVRFTEAREQAKEQLSRLYEKAKQEVGEHEAAVFEVHRMMLDGVDFADSITKMIRAQEVNAEYAVAHTGEEFAAVFESMEDDYMKARSEDMRDIASRVIAILQGRKTEELRLDEPVILLADRLTPGETVQLDKTKILAVVTRHGSVYSHAAILARAMNIPAVMGVDFPEDVDGKSAIVDGYEGVLYVEPDDALRTKYRNRKNEDEKQKHLLMELKGKDNVTPDGKRIDLFANIGSVSDVADAVTNDAGGIGLFRSEFLYLEAEDYPDEEKQLQAYRAVAEGMEGKPVVIRTMDIGADKQANYFKLDKEENPAMGYRGIRICLERKDIFQTQLRALYRAARYGRISILFPMITSVEEVREIKKITGEVKAELEREGIPYKDAPLGIMIETPAAALMSEELAQEVDFFSIGTNDLTQYTLAADRQNAKLERLYDPHHPAILKMIQMVVENGHKHHCRVGICGELGADLTMTKIFLELGVDELSVNPPMILKIREKILSMD